jgi:hypothetical protein
MHIRPIIVLALAAACSSLSAAEDQPAAPKPGFLKRTADTLWPFNKKSGGAKAGEPGKLWKQLVPSIAITPLPVKLSEARTFKVTLQLSNKGRKLVQLDFPTTQRIEVLVTDASGKRVEQWSEDQAFDNEPTLVTINAGERLEYVANVATRDLKAGEKYTVEAFFPNFDQLRATKTITPES